MAITQQKGPEFGTMAHSYRLGYRICATLMTKIRPNVDSIPVLYLWISSHNCRTSTDRMNSSIIKRSLAIVLLGTEDPSKGYLPFGAPHFIRSTLCLAALIRLRVCWNVGFALAPLLNRGPKVCHCQSEILRNPLTIRDTPHLDAPLLLEYTKPGSRICISTTVGQRYRGTPLSIWDTEDCSASGTVHIWSSHFTCSTHWWDVGYAWAPLLKGGTEVRHCQSGILSTYPHQGYFPSGRQTLSRVHNAEIRYTPYLETLHSYGVAYINRAARFSSCASQMMGCGICISTTVERRSRVTPLSILDTEDLSPHQEYSSSWRMTLYGVHNDGIWNLH